MHIGVKISRTEIAAGGTSFTVFISEDILRAVFSVESAYGFVSVKDLPF